MAENQETANQEPVAEVEAQPAKVRSIVVDTLTAIQTEEWMTSLRRPGHDEWMDNF